jgi:hypothetical protein
MSFLIYEKITRNEERNFLSHKNQETSEKRIKMFYFCKFSLSLKNIFKNPINFSNSRELLKAL